MDDCLVKNLEVLRVRHPRLHALVQLVEPAKHHLLSGGDQLRKMTEFVNASSDKRPMLFCIYGFDSGEHVREYLKKRKCQIMMIVEKSVASFKLALTLHDWSSALSDPSVDWVIGYKPEELKTHFRDYFKDLQRLCFSASLENAFWMPSIECDGSYYLDTAKKMIEGRDSAVMDIKADPEDNYRGLVNLVGNLNSLSQFPFFDSYKNMFLGKTGIVVSTGPSLNASLAALKKVADKVVIFCVDSALGILLNAGITPHFVACLERVVATKKLFEDMPAVSSVLVTLPLVAKETQEMYKGPKSWILSRGIDYSWLLGNQTSHQLGLSASTLAFQGLNLLGCEPIVLLGQDLAFDRETKRSHALGASEFLQNVGSQKLEEVQKDNKSDDLVMGNNGEPILTWEPYRRIADYMSFLIQKSGKTCYNAIHQERGMKLEHTRLISPDDLSSLILSPATDVLNKIGEQTKKSSLPSGLEINDRCNLAVEELKYIQSKCLSVLQSMSIFYHKNLPSYISDELRSIYKSHLMEVEKSINDLVLRPGFQGLVWPFVLRMHVDIISRYYSLRDKEGDFFETVVTSFNLLRDWHKQAHHWAARLQYLLKTNPESLHV